MTKRSESEARRHGVQAPLGQRVVSAAMSALLVFSMWPTGATRALAEAIAPEPAQDSVEEVYEPEAEELAVAQDQATGGIQASDEAQAAAEAEVAASAGGGTSLLLSKLLPSRPLPSRPLPIKPPPSRLPLRRRQTAR